MPHDRHSLDLSPTSGSLPPSKNTSISLLSRMHFRRSNRSRESDQRQSPRYVVFSKGRIVRFADLQQMPSSRSAHQIAFPFWRAYARPRTAGLLLSGCKGRMAASMMGAPGTEGFRRAAPGRPGVAIFDATCYGKTLYSRIHGFETANAGGPFEGYLVFQRGLCSSTGAARVILVGKSPVFLVKMKRNSVSKL